MNEFTIGLFSIVLSTATSFCGSVSECNLHCMLIFQYIHPTDAHKLGQAELLVIDEAAAIPLPYVKSMLGPYLVFLASTINGLVNSIELKTS